MGMRSHAGLLVGYKLATRGAGKVHISEGHVPGSFVGWESPALLHGRLIARCMLDHPCRVHARDREIARLVPFFDTCLVFEFLPTMQLRLFSLVFFFFYRRFRYVMHASIDLVPS